MWKLRKLLFTSIIRYPVKIAFLLLKHNKKSITVTSEYNLSYGSHKLQCYDLHTYNCNNNLPTVFYIHGGSWMSIDKSNYNYIVKTIGENGYRVVNINYRLMPEFTLQDVVSDCENAIQHAIRNIKDINLDKLIICGDSAGAHLASLIAAKASNNLYENGIKFISTGLFYGLFNMKDMYNSNSWLFRYLERFFKEEVGEDYKEYLSQYSPLEYFNQDYPPTFITSGTIDSLNPATMTFIKTLQDNSIKYKSIIFDRGRKDGIHGFLSLLWFRSSKESLREMICFFNRILNNYI